jgi:hypothetical protein
MLSKIIAGVLAAAVLTVGGYAYWEYSSDTPGSCHQSTEPCSVQSTATPPCCQEPSRTGKAGEPCCCCEGEEGTPEVLAIAPRELK